MISNQLSHQTIALTNIKVECNNVKNNKAKNNKLKIISNVLLKKKTKKTWDKNLFAVFPSNQDTLNTQFVCRLCLD